MMTQFLPLMGAINGKDAINQLLILLVVGIVLGIVAYLVSKAPFINDLFKTILQWLIYLVGALVLINFLLTLVGYPLIEFK